MKNTKMSSKRKQIKKPQLASYKTSPFDELGLDLLAYVQKGGAPQVNVDRLPASVSQSLLKGQGLHAEKLQAAWQGVAQRYEWIDMDHNLVLQTRLLPLPKQRGETAQKILVSVRNITWWTQVPGEPVPGMSRNMLHETEASYTFSQLLLAAREEEKKNISKALHDEIGSAAVILTSLLSLVRVSLQRGLVKQALADLHELDVQIKNSIEQLKNIVVSLRPLHLEQDGALADSIHTLVDHVSNYAQITGTFSCPATFREKGISDNIKIMLYRVVQEALSNVAKHAHAKRVEVKLMRKQNVLYMTVEDNGVGFVIPTQVTVNHIGLPAMRDSVRLLGGKISIQSVRGKGTCIKVQCPCVFYGEQL